MDWITMSLEARSLAYNNVEHGAVLPAVRADDIGHCQRTPAQELRLPDPRFVLAPPASDGVPKLRGVGPFGSLPNGTHCSMNL